MNRDWIEIIASIIVAMLFGIGMAFIVWALVRVTL